MEHHCASKIRIRYQELDIKTWYVRKWCHMFSYTSVWCHVAPVKAEITGRATRVNLMKRLMTAGGDKKGFGNICWHHLIASFRSGAIWRPEVSEAYGLPTMWRLSSWCHLIGSGGQNSWHIYNVSHCSKLFSKHLISGLSTCQVKLCASDVSPQVLPIFPFRRPWDSTRIFAISWAFQSKPKSRQNEGLSEGK